MGKGRGRVVGAAVAAGMGVVCVCMVVGLGVAYFALGAPCDFAHLEDALLVGAPSAAHLRAARFMPLIHTTYISYPKP